MGSNKKSGSTFEHDFCVLAHDNAFWAHMLTANKNGQPSDVIISKNNISALVDCKVCENNIFKLSRIEENQELAMSAWIKAGNEHAVFALKIFEDIRIINYVTLMSYKFAGMKQLNSSDIFEYSESFTDWMGGFDGNNSQ